MISVGTKTVHFSNQEYQKPKLFNNLIQIEPISLNKP